MPSTPRRLLPWIVAAAVAIGLLAWAIVAQSSTVRPNNDEADLIQGRPATGGTTPEGHLAWALDVIDGWPVDADEIERRFAPAFLEQISPASFAAATEEIIEGSPYRFFGYRTDDDGTAVALVSDRADATFAVTVTVDIERPDQLSGLLVSPVEVGRGPFSTAEFALHAIAGVVLAMAGALVASAGRRGRFGAVLATAGLIWLCQLLELSDHRVAYTVGLVAGPVAVAAVAVAVLLAPDGVMRGWGDRVIVALVALATLASIAVVSAIDTGAVSLPDHLVSIRGSAAVARVASRLDAALVVAVAAGLMVTSIVRQRRAGWARSPALVPTTVAVAVAVVVASVPAVAAVIDSDHLDLSTSPVFAVAAMVVAFGITGTVLALENEHLLALQSSRVRIVQAGEDARRELERNLHDGAQQRLLSVMLALRLGRDRFGGSDIELDGFLDGVTADLGQAVHELRELSRGLHPAILEQGVVAAVESLAESSSIPVTVAGDHTARYPSAVEHAAYFVIAEALTNATRHAGAGHVDVQVGGSETELRVRVSDDGCGGARVGGGTGLQGLADRVSVFGGSWTLVSPPGVGTVVEASLPCE